MKKKTQDSALSFRIDQKLKKFLERSADADKRSVSSLAHKILEEWAAKQGFKP